MQAPVICMCHHYDETTGALVIVGDRNGNIFCFEEETGVLRARMRLVAGSVFAVTTHKGTCVYTPPTNPETGCIPVCPRVLSLLFTKNTRQSLRMR